MSKEVIVADKTLVVSGSLSKVTNEQLYHLKEQAHTCFFEINPVELVNQSLDMNTLIQQFKNYLDAKCLIIYVNSSEINRIAASGEAGKKRGFSLNQVSDAIAHGLGKAARAILDEYTEINSLILTGGDTSKVNL